jgi:hypothetical protein
MGDFLTGVLKKTESAPSLSSQIPSNSNKSQFEYGNLIVSHIGKKRVLRKFLVQKFVKERKAKESLSREELNQAMTAFKLNLIDWYYRNICEIISQELERAEYAINITELRRQYKLTPYCKLIFAKSAIKDNADYYSSKLL